MELKLIDFHAKFMQDYMQWSAEHPKEAADEEMAADIFYSMYEAWLQSPKDWLGGKSPNAYFEDIGDVQMYVSAWIEYVLEDLELPDPLISCMVERKAAIYPILLGILLKDGDAAEKAVSPEELSEIRGAAIHLIEKMREAHPYRRYIALLKEQQEDSLLLQEASEALLEAAENGEDIGELLIDAGSGAKGEAKKAIVDILSHLPPGDDRVLDMLLIEFAAPDADVAFLADCLGRYGDERALEPLKSAVHRPGLTYYAFKEIKNAIEEISGEEIEEEDFTGDSLYDFLKGEDEEKP